MLARMSRHIVITGASSGIGAACARSFAALGHRMSLGARRTEKLAAVVDDAICHHLDVTDPTSIEQFLNHVEEANGPIDALINNAGLARDDRDQRPRRARSHAPRATQDGRAQAG